MSFSRFVTFTSLACLLPLAANATEVTTAPAVQAPAPVAVAPTPAATTNASAPVTRGEFTAMVRETLLNNPEIIMDAVKKMREKQEAETKKKAAEGLVKYKSDIFDAESPSVGAKDADVTIVEFFDYHCGYCKHLLPVVTQAINEDKKVRFIFKEFPILSEDSVTAARAALAVNRVAKDKYFDFHQALMKSNVKFDEKMLLETAKKLGIDTAKLKAEMGKPEITAILDKNREIAGTLNISGTPALIMGDEIAPGAVSYEELKSMIQAVRSGKKPVEELQATKEAEAAKEAAKAAPAPAAAPKN